jgi:hypothetical protein
VICGLICLPQIIESSKHGGVVSAYETKQFPEAEIGGRNVALDVMNNDFTYSILFNLNSVFFQKYDFTINFPKAFLVLVLSIFAIKILLQQKEFKYKILLILALNCFALYFLAKIFSPILYFPERYLGYILPLILPIIIFTAINIVLNNKFPKTNQSGIIILSIILLILFKPQINDKTGLNIDDTENKPLFEFIKTLPKNALIAGFPIGVMDSVKYLSGKNFYFNFETSVPIHKKHILEIRVRAKEFFKAYYATNFKTLKNFSNKTGVNYILVDEEKLDKQIPPNYYKPLGKIALKFFKKAKNREFILKKLKNQAIFKYNHYFLIKI